ncbi:MAG: PEGA domain-containing protein [Legionellaceae bacterium]|nr:PEGA domain-containing protein [Legionellaceae bacterium]
MISIWRKTLKINKLKQLSLVGVLAGSAVLAGCASIVNGTTEGFTVDSAPSHAQLTIDGLSQGQTPVQINLKRDQDHTIKLTLAGYKSVTIQLQKSVSGWVFGNIVFGGLIGLAIDAVDGAMYKLTPQQMSAYAASTGAKYNGKDNTFTVIMVKNANKNWQKIGQLKKAS